MTFPEPIPFTAAIEQLEAKGLLVTAPEVGTRELQQHVSVELRERSFFTARLLNTMMISDARNFLLELKTSLDSVVKGQSNYAKENLRLTKFLDSINYSPQLGKEGTIEDLSSNRRLNLILRINTMMVRQYGVWQQRNRPGELIAFPALELLRVSPRIKKRAWIERWNDARDRLGASTTATEARGSEASDEDGINAFALKTDQIWPAISRFGLPYEPFDFNSGMGTRAVRRDETEQIGIIKPGQPVPPAAPRGMNDGLEASLAGLDDDLVDVLEKSLSDDVEIVSDVLRFRSGLRNRGGRLVKLMAEDFIERDRGQAVLHYLQEAP